MKKWFVLSAGLIFLSAGVVFSMYRAKASSQPGLPDLIVDQKRLLQNWVVRDEKLPATFCSVEEGGIIPGEHTLLRFTVSTPNVGTADVTLGGRRIHFENNDGLYEF